MLHLAFKMVVRMSSRTQRSRAGRSDEADVGLESAVGSDADRIRVWRSERLGLMMVTNSGRQTLARLSFDTISTNGGKSSSSSSTPAWPIADSKWLASFVQSRYSRANFAFDKVILGNFFFSFFLRRTLSIVGQHIIVATHVSRARLSFFAFLTQLLRPARCRPRPCMQLFKAEMLGRRGHFIPDF